MKENMDVVEKTEDGQGQKVRTGKGQEAETGKDQGQKNVTEKTGIEGMDVNWNKKWKPLRLYLSNCRIFVYTLQLNPLKIISLVGYIKMIWWRISCNASKIVWFIQLTNSLKTNIC